MDESIRGPRGAHVALINVARSFGRRAALLPTNLEIQSGEFVSILGPSGSGKSTLLRLIAGLEKPGQGTISVSSNVRGEVETSFVFQDPALLPWRTVLENVALPLELKNVSRSEARRSAGAALVRVGLADALDLFPNQLSGGMKMRTSVARALVSEPSLLLLDEPFAALDEPTRFRLQEDLRKIWQTSRMTVIFVTHSVSEAAFVSDRALVLMSGPGRLALDRRLSLSAVEHDSRMRTDAAYLQEVMTLTKAFGERS